MEGLTYILLALFVLYLAAGVVLPDFWPFERKAGVTVTSSEDETAGSQGWKSWGEASGNGGGSGNVGGDGYGYGSGNSGGDGNG